MLDFSPLPSSPHPNPYLTLLFHTDKIRYRQDKIDAARKFCR